MEIPDAERDAGKEVLYQVTQQAYNELLDLLFKKKEDDALKAAVTKRQREKYKELIERTNWDDVKDQYNEDDESEDDDLDGFRKKSLNELLAQSGYAVDPALEKQGGEANDDVLDEIDNIYQSATEMPGEPAPIGEPITTAPEPEEGDGSLRDPTMPQFRPNSVAEAVSAASVAVEVDGALPSSASREGQNGPPEAFRDKGKGPALDYEAMSKKVKLERDAQNQTATDPAPVEVIDRKSLQLWKAGQMAEDEAKQRGGWGRLSFEEFEKIYDHEERRDNRLDYLGSWIDFCIP